MKAMILAAGAGTRLATLTDHIPKPMIQVGGRPILEHNIRLAVQHGVDQVVINLHHCSEVVTTYFGHGARWRVSITYSYEPTLLGTAGAIKKVGSLFSDPFFLLYGDNLTNCDLARLWRAHLCSDGVGTLALYYRDDPTASGIAQLDKNDRITRFLEKPGREQVFSRWVNAGLMVLEPKVMDYIPSDCPSDLGRDIIPKLLRGKEDLFGYRMSEELWWIDTPADLARLQTAVGAGEVQLP